MGCTNLPGHKADRLDNGRLHDLLARENTPCDSVRSVRVVVRSEISALVDHVVGNVRVLLDLRYQGREEVWREEEFEIRLIADIRGLMLGTLSMVTNKHAPSGTHIR